MNDFFWMHLSSVSAGVGVHVVMALGAAILGLLAVVDFWTFRLPDVLVAGLAALGCCMALSGLLPVVGGGGLDLLDAVEGAAAGGLGLVMVGRAGRWLAPVAGLSLEELGDGPVIGLGDAKLLGAIGCWVGPFGLPFVLVIGCSLALLVAGVCRLDPARTVVAFGPYLCAGGVAVIYEGPWMANLCQL